MPAPESDGAVQNVEVSLAVAIVEVDRAPVVPTGVYVEQPTGYLLPKRPGHVLIKRSVGNVRPGGARRVTNA
jgi:hypothetical protein